jgi:mannosyltransferase
VDRLGGRPEDALSRSRDSWFPLAVLAVAIAVGAYLRFYRLGEPSYWLDEILHQHQTDLAATRSWWRWLGQLENENGGLYYLTQLVTRLFGRSEFAGRSAAAFFGLAAIPLVWLAPLDRRVRGAAVILLAVSPLHVYYSREARGYALLLFLTAALIVILMRARSTIGAAVVLVAMAYTSAVAATVIASAVAVAFLLALLDRERRRWYATTGALGIAALALFRVIYASRPPYDPSLPGFPAVDWPFLTSLARMFSVTALGAEVAGRAAAAMFVFAVIGAVVLLRRDRAHGIVLIGMTFLPLATSLLALWLLDHFFAVRYVVASVIGYVLLAATGMAATASLVVDSVGSVPSPHVSGERVRVRGGSREKVAAVAIVIATLTAAQAWSSARTEPFRKLDWRGVAESLRRHVRPGDVILTAEHWSDVSLRYYLGEIPNVRQVFMAGIGIAEIVLNDAPASWLITAGASGDTSVRGWMCRYPVVLSSELEGFRLHYAPSRAYLLQHRSTAAEQRAWSAALGDSGFTIRMDNDLLLGTGWANPEGSGDDTFRWAVGARATVVLPRRAPRDRTIRFDAYPVTPQTMRVSLNGKPLGAITLPHEWREYSMNAPAALWTEGPNTLTFDFEKAIVPSPIDSRELAVSFRWISVGDPKPAPTHATRIAADMFIDANTAWRNTKTNFPPAQLRREPVEALLGRLGFDPLTGWTKLARGDLRLDNVVATIAAGSDCEDDLTFLNRTFAILVEHPPNEGAQRDLLQRLRNGDSRQHIISRIVKSDDFRDRVLGESPP